MNILIKLTCLVGLVIAPLLGNHGEATTALTDNDKVVQVTVTPATTEGETTQVKAVIITQTEENGKTVNEEIQIEGTEVEVQEALKNMEGVTLEIKK